MAPVSGDSTGSRSSDARAQAGRADAAEIAQLSFEEARAELDATVAALERGNVPLDEAVALWERGEALVQHCRARLEAVKAQVVERMASRSGDSQDVAPGDASVPF